MKKTDGPKILFLDIETSPIISYTWGLWDQNVALNQVQSDWHILSWGAKWQGDTKVMYQDQSKAKVLENDKKLLEGIWKLLDEADIVVGQNSRRFDIKKLNARFIINGMQPPSSFKQIDTLELAKKHFAFTSNKLEYMADKINTKYKKLKHETFAGFELWKECLKGNQAAWKAMKRYNIYDVLSLEELYNKLIPWDSTINFNLYTDGITEQCTCGGTHIQSKGYAFTPAGKFRRMKCLDCGKETRDKVNQFSKEKKKSLRSSVVR